MHNPVSIRENDTHKHLWDFGMQTDHLTSARWRVLIVINNNNKKRTCKIVGFVVPTDHRIKMKESEKKDKFLDFAQELKKKKKTMEHEGDDYTNRDWCFWYSHQRIIEGSGGLGGWRTSGDHPNYCIIENGQNTEKSSGDSRRLVITVKDAQGVNNGQTRFQTKYRLC